MLASLYKMGLFGYFTDGKEFSASTVILLCVVAAVLCAISGYLLGSVNSAVIISKLLYRDDIRKYGSGNAGMTNMLRTFGKKAAVFTFVGDVGKSALAVLLGRLIGFPPIIGDLNGTLPLGGYIAGLCVVLGHAFPIFYGFRGGKGVLCTATVAALLSPFVFIWLVLLFVGLLALTKYVSLASIICAMAYPVVLNRIEGPSLSNIFALIMGGLVVYLHRENIKRLLERKENKLSLKKKPKDTVKGDHNVL